MHRTVIVIPTHNEAYHIAQTVSSLSGEMEDGDLVPIWVLDGMSSDGTGEVVQNLKLDHVKIIMNPEKTQAHALNYAARLAYETGEFDLLIRADAHAQYPPNFVSRIRETFEQERADSVVVPLKTVGGSRLQDAAEILFGTWLGTGGSPHRTGSVRGYVEHGHHAGFRLDAYMRVGGYDTDFKANEDAEFDYRLTAAGGKIFLENDLSIGYIPRPSLASTFRQYSRNGKYRIRRAVKHGISLSPRQLLPALLFPALGTSSLAALFISPLFGIVPTGYIIGIAAAAFLIASRRGNIALTVDVAVLAMASHLGFSVGASLEVFKCWLSVERRNFLRNDRVRLLSDTSSKEGRF